MLWVRAAHSGFERTHTILLPDDISKVLGPRLFGKRHVERTGAHQKKLAKFLTSLLARSSARNDALLLIFAPVEKPKYRC
jgi:hypothetical protein